MPSPGPGSRPEPSRLHAHARGDDAPRALGASLLERSSPIQLPERAKVIAVLRRANALMTHAACGVTDEAGLKRVLAAAERDIGLGADEHRAIVGKDAELAELELSFVAAVRSSFAR